MGIIAMSDYVQILQCSAFYTLQDNYNHIPISNTSTAYAVTHHVPTRNYNSCQKTMLMNAKKVSPIPASAVATPADFAV